MKRLILPMLALLTMLAVCVGCSEDESEPVITRIHVAPECGVLPVRVDVYGAASGGDESGPATGGANNLKYTWNFGDGATSTTSLAYHIYDTAGDFAVSLKVEDPGGKTAVAERVVTIIADSMTIAAEAAPAAAVLGEPVNLDYRAMSCEIDPDVAGDYRNLVQTWEIIRISDGVRVGRYAGKSPNHTFTAAGTYEVRLSVAYPAWSVTRRDVLTIEAN
ncbi:MAG: PKD domain-containing protein [bacterium]|nr:PKD domain-containing protein [bacterium]